MFGTPELTRFRLGGCHNSADSFVIEDGWIVAQTIHYTMEKEWIVAMLANGGAEFQVYDWRPRCGVAVAAGSVATRGPWFDIVTIYRRRPDRPCSDAAICRIT